MWFYIGSNSKIYNEIKQLSEIVTYNCDSKQKKRNGNGNIKKKYLYMK